MIQLKDSKILIACVHLFEGSVAYNVQKRQSINVRFVLKESEEICCTPFDYY
jgi:hypothetical protein